MKLVDGLSGISFEDALVHVKSINALDLSPGMLEIARSRVATTSLPKGKPIPDIRFYEYDALKADSFPDVQTLEKADVVLSTLVLEHLPLDVFFDALKSFAKEGGYVVITNMHAEMGRKSQAGFVDEASGEKIRGESFVYEVQEVVDAGRKWGFSLEVEVMERGVMVDDLKNGIVGERGRKWIGVMCWFGMVLRYEGC